MSHFRNTTTYLATETQRHREEHAASSALDAAPRSGGRGVPTANERPLDRGSVVRLRSARLTARPAVQADRVERLLCVSVSLWLVQINTSASLRNAVLGNHRQRRSRLSVSDFVLRLSISSVWSSVATVTPRTRKVPSAWLISSILPFSTTTPGLDSLGI